MPSMAYQGIWISQQASSTTQPDVVTADSVRCRLQDDGNMVLYGEGSCFAGWASNTDGKGHRQTRRVLQNGSVLSLRNSSGRTIWTSRSQLKLQRASASLWTSSRSFKPCRSDSYRDLAILEILKVGGLHVPAKKRSDRMKQR